MPPVRVTITTPTFSDGDPNHLPTTQRFMYGNDTSFRRILATRWVSEYGTGALQGSVYELNQMPAGYSVFVAPRVDNKVDKYIFGHPSYRPYKSCNQFYPHFVYLMFGGGQPCTCKNCNARGFQPPPLRQAVQVFQPVNLAGQGQPAVARPMGEDLATILEHLENGGRWEQSMEDAISMDWRDERALLPGALEQMNHEPSFLPRVGELVLWCRDIPSGISQKETGEIEVFNPISETFHGSPGWMGGVVTQVPIPAAYPGLGADRHSLKYSGYRVECFSDVNEQDKSRSATYDYVPVQQIRPLGLWQEVMHGVPEDRWHPTIFHCLSAMATFSPIERYWFKGVWPDLNIHSKGCYLGAESIFVGDAVRILPDDKASPITDVLYVTDIVMMFRGLCRETDAMNIWEAAQGFGVEFHGYSYTLDVERSERRLLAEPQNPAMSGYGPWYHSHEPNQLRGADFSFVNGRLCEAGVLQRWFPHSSTPFMERGHNGIIEGYNYATSHDNRVQTSILPLTITNSRGEGLDMPTVNGFDINENRYISQPDVVAPWSERRQAQMPSLLWGFAPMDQSLAGIMAEAGESSRAAAGWGEEEGWMGEGWMGEGWMGEGWMEEGWMEGEEAEAETETEKRKEGEVKAILERMEVEMGFEEE